MTPEESGRPAGRPRSCLACGVALTGRQRSACSERCRREASRLRAAQAIEAERVGLLERISDLEQELAALRPLLARVAELEADKAALRQKGAELQQVIINLNRQRQARPR
jgi:hypothetical protein